MPATLTRRTAIKASLLAGLGLAAPSISPGRLPLLAYSDEPDSYNALLGNPPMLGRVESDWQPLQSIRSDATNPDSVTRVTDRHEVIPIFGAIHAAAPYPRYAHNDVWFETDGGYIHSSYVVPVREIFNEPEKNFGDGFWGEISVPLTRQRASPDNFDLGKFTFFYGQTFRVVERMDDAAGRAWYRLSDDGYNRAWWVDARHIRRLFAAEFAPISPEVPPDHKRVEVSIADQTLHCYEADRLVFSTRVASGTAYVNDAGEQFGFNTPPGRHWIQHKRPSRRMTGGDPDNAANHYDLPGVPWCAYFTSTGAAIHGTFWHNNFGIPQSHGCLNVTNDAARWVYRWVNPWTDQAPDNTWTGDDDQGIATSVIITA